MDVSRRSEAYLANISFLVVDDNEFMRHLLRRVLKALNAQEVREAPDGTRALEMMHHFSPDVLIVDWMMDPMDGIELTRQLRNDSDSPNPFIPIIMVSAHADRGRVIVARDSGVNEFVVKPISATTLYSRIRTVIDKPRPFVRTKDFFGPDRRRTEQHYLGPDRRGAAVDMAAPDRQPMAQDEINELFNPEPEDSETPRRPH